MSSSKSFSIILLTLFFCSLNKNVLASDWVEMYVLTNRIIVLKFDDGYIHHSGYRAPETTTETFNFPLDISMASATNTYKIHSLTDPNYQSAVHPFADR